MDEEITIETYPKGLRIFTQFILIPLLSLYLTILYFYGGKIILHWDWPRGIVSYMIIVISVLGIFTNLLLFPIQDQKETGWIKKFNNAFYFLLIPLVAILFLAISIRIGDYGLTVNRYIIVLMGIWLTFISGYFILGFKNIKIIPLSLAVFMFFSSFGPWGMFGISRRVQINRLETILSREGILKEGKIQNEVKWRLGENGKILPISTESTHTLSSMDLQKVNSIVQYLEDYHGMTGILPWFQQDLKAILMEAEAKSDRYGGPDYSRLIVESMGLEFIPGYMIGHDKPSYQYFSFISGNSNIIPVSGYDYLLRISSQVSRQQASSETTASMDYPRKSIKLKVKEQNVEIGISDMLDKLVLDVEAEYDENVDPESMMVEREMDGLHIRIYFDQINYNVESGEGNLTHAQGIVLVKELTSAAK